MLTRAWQWILNKSARRHEHTIYPYVHSSSNWRSAQDLLQGVRIPECVICCGGVAYD